MDASLSGHAEKVIAWSQPIVAGHDARRTVPGINRDPYAKGRLHPRVHSHGTSASRSARVQVPPRIMARYETESISYLVALNVTPKSEEP